MKLTTKQMSQIDDVRTTLNAGILGVWVNPAQSLDACIAVLQKVKESLK